MRPLSSSHRALFGSAIVVATASLLSAGCLFPDYTFDAPEPGAGASGGDSTTGGAGGAGAAAGGNISGGDGGGGGEPPPVEDCLSGVDDDGDGDVDCDDADCQPDFECVPPVPVGWDALGHAALYQGSSQSLPQCPDYAQEVAYEGGAALDGGSGGCTACTCAAPTGQSCTLETDLDGPRLGLQPLQVSNKFCGQVATELSTLTVPEPWGGGCYQQDTLPEGTFCMGDPCNRSVNSSAPTVSGGSCNPGGGSPVLPTPTFGETARACRVSMGGGGCGGSQVCMPRPASPFERRVCIGRSGDHTCPGGLFTEKLVFHQGFDDARDCSSCTCGAPTGGACEITIGMYDDPAVGTCNNSVASFTAGSCVNISGNPAIFGLTAAVTQAPSGGSCGVTGGGVPTGDVTPNDPTTFCCLP